MGILNAATQGSTNLPTELKPLAVTVQRTQELLGIRNTKIWELINNGTLKTISIGKRRLVLYASIERLVDALMASDQKRSKRADRAIEASVAARRARGASLVSRRPKRPRLTWSVPNQLTKK
jgi:hypothetical protein